MKARCCLTTSCTSHGASRRAGKLERVRQPHQHCRRACFGYSAHLRTQCIIEVSVLKQVATHVGVFILGIVARTALDLELGAWVVRLLYWVPVRGLFRSRVPMVAGSWDQYWEAGSTNFSDARDRHGQTLLRQFFRYCYAEFYAGSKKYAMFGRIQGEHIVGRWYDVRDERGYHGSFQLSIVDDERLSGVWIGHSK